MKRLSYTVLCAILSLFVAYSAAADENHIVEHFSQEDSCLGPTPMSGEYSEEDFTMFVSCIDDGIEMGIQDCCNIGENFRRNKVKVKCTASKYFGAYTYSADNTCDPEIACQWDPTGDSCIRSLKFLISKSQKFISAGWKLSDLTCSVVTIMSESNAESCYIHATEGPLPADIDANDIM